MAHIGQHDLVHLNTWDQNVCDIQCNIKYQIFLQLQLMLDVHLTTKIHNKKTVFTNILIFFERFTAKNSRFCFKGKTLFPPILPKTSELGLGLANIVFWFFGENCFFILATKETSKKSETQSEFETLQLSHYLQKNIISLALLVVFVFVRVQK